MQEVDKPMCSIFTLVSSMGSCLVGRNFDWLQKGGSIHFFPSYRSYGVQTNGFCAVEQMGTDRPYEGMNVNGLFLGMAAIPGEMPPSQSRNSLLMNDLGIMRFILERAESVVEALEIFRKFAIDYMQDRGYPKVHYLLADRSGNAAIFYS